MDDQTRIIFDRADAALYRATASTDGVLTLTQTSPETSALAAALMKVRECASRLADALSVLDYYADPAVYERTPIEGDKGMRARALRDRLAD